MNIEEFKYEINELGRERVPFLFIVDFEMKRPLVFKLSEVTNDEVLYSINGFTNTELKKSVSNCTIIKSPVDFKTYQNKFQKVLKHLEYGDSFLTNLTMKTKIQLSCSLREVFHASQSKYKLLLRDQYLVFSPEIFIQIKENKIYSFPMKGTINADIPDAEKIILNDKKELAEHVTIVDLIRNDLSMVASNVEVTRFRYVDQITTNQKNLLQVSSEIRGTLQNNWPSHMGDILLELLPAGSVSGAPKKRTCEIIQEAEEIDRGYYTGIVGLFDGVSLDSGVMIRYIEKDRENLYYRSGGGITTQSIAEAEYQEAIDKVYVPIH